MKRLKTLQGRLLFGIMMISACITSIVVLFSFYLDYDDELATQNKMYLQIEALSVPALARPIWDLDEKAIEAQIFALNTIRDIVKVEVYDENNQLLRSSTAKQGLQVDEVRTYPIFSDKSFSQNEIQIGSLRVEVTKKFIFDRLLSKFLIFFLSQFVKTLLVSTLIFIFIYRLVTKRILDLGKYISENENRAVEKWQPYVPEFAQDHQDELSQLEEALNRQTKKIVQLNQKNNELIWSQSEELDRQRQNAFESARLASVAELSSGIAHEINNPLAIMSLTVSNMEKSLGKNDPKEKVLVLLEKIKSMIQRMSKVISAMKVSARDGTEDAMSPVLVSKLIAEAQVLSQARISDSGIDFELIHNIPQNVAIIGREAQILQILINLLNNAFDAVLEQKNAWIRLEVIMHDNRSVEFRVIDSGPGISQELQSKLFIPFFTTKEVGHGVGLGLSISRNNATANNGELFLDTQSKNTTFVLRLPAVIASF